MCDRRTHIDSSADHDIALTGGGYGKHLWEVTFKEFSTNSNLVVRELFVDILQDKLTFPAVFGRRSDIRAVHLAREIIIIRSICASLSPSQMASIHGLRRSHQYWTLLPRNHGRPASPVCAHRWA